MEIFVQDFTRVSLTFVVYDWDGPLVGDDFLGACKLNLMIVCDILINEHVIS